MPLYFLVAFNIIAFTVAHMMLKKGVSLLGNINLSWLNLWNLSISVIKNFYIVGGLFLMGVGFMIWLFILSRINISIVYTISTSLTIVAVVAASYFLFNESLNFLHIAGIAAIVFGIFLILYR